MIELTIDNKKVSVEQGTTILDAANKLGVEIPTMCFLDSCTPSTSCMACAVRVNGNDTLVPACATHAVNGMLVESESKSVIFARKAAIELLLSDHVGDCLGPCHVTCPAKMNIPLMIKQIAAGDYAAAIKTVKDDIALPAVLGRICPAPCEKSCRRAQLDSPVSICLLKRFVADVDLALDKPYVPKCKPDTGKKIAIAGAGPSGLTAAFHLARHGHKCTVFDQYPSAGGMLRFAVTPDRLPLEVLNAEIAIIEKLGVTFNFNTTIGEDITIDQLQDKYDVVLLALGKDHEQYIPDRLTYQTETSNIFVVGESAAKRRMSVVAEANGKAAAHSIDQFLMSGKAASLPKIFNSRIGKLKPHEIDAIGKTASQTPRIEPANPENAYSSDQARQEALRCLHCQCRKPDTCKLREYAQQYHCRQGQYKTTRRDFTQQVDHPEIVFEPAKCIDCGLCVQITQASKEPIGLSFIGRGFNVTVAAPFNKTIAEALVKTVKKCEKACPTAAIAYKHA
jgi:hypothetical protein